MFCLTFAEDKLHLSITIKQACCSAFGLHYLCTKNKEYEENIKSYRSGVFAWTYCHRHCICLLTVPRKHIFVNYIKKLYETI